MREKCLTESNQQLLYHFVYVLSILAGANTSQGNSENWNILQNAWQWITLEW